jgi:hypothetical protein
LRTIKKIDLDPFSTSLCFGGESSKWWNSFDEDTIFYSTWGKFEELFSNKWIRDTKMEEMYRIQDVLKEAK